MPKFTTQLINMRLITIIGILVLVSSCKQKDSNKKVDLKQQYIENDSLYTTLKAHLYTIAFNPIFDGDSVSTSKTDKKNSLPIDKTLIFEQTKFHFRQDGFSEIITLASIKNPQFKFLDSITIGSKKSLFQNQIRSKIHSNLIRIGNSENNSFFSFSFKDGTLRAIDYEYH